MRKRKILQHEKEGKVTKEDIHKAVKKIAKFSKKDILVVFVYIFSFLTFLCLWLWHYFFDFFDLSVDKFIEEVIK